MKSKITVVFGFCILFLIGLIVIGRGSPITFAEGGEAFTFLPIVSKPAPDVLITAVEVNQSVQRANNSVPLVANRNTLVRVYASSPNGAQNNIVVRLTASRNGGQIGQLSSAPTTIPQSTSRDNPSSSVNFQLPSSWLNGNVTLTAQVDATNVIPNEPNESNNTVVTSMNFNNVPDLQIKIVPIQYTHQGPTRPGVYPPNEVDYITNWIERVYPISEVDLSFRLPYSFVGNLQDSDSWLLVQNNQPVGGLLWDMYLLKSSDYAPADPDNLPIVYYAFVPVTNNSGTWFSSGIAGIGWIGYRESVGLNLGNTDQTGSLAGHEVGHNLGRRHAPCGNPAGPDPNYPYSGASIGEYGIDIPNGAFWTPNTAVDFMSYCDPSWTSDYTYIGLFNDQSINGHTLQRAPVNSMIVAAGLTESGEMGLNATYAFETIPSPEPADSDYRVELLNEAGQVIASHAMQLREAAEEGVSGKVLLATVPLPAEPAATVQIVANDGNVRAARPLASAALSRSMTAAATRDGDSITLTWPAADTPAIVRYTPDDGESWYGIGLEIMGGEFTIESNMLPEGENGRFEIILSNTGSPALLMAEMP